MRTDKSITIAIPAYNEEGNIRYVVEDSLNVLRNLTNKYEVLVVNDASIDKTGDILGELNNKYPEEVRVINHQENGGTAQALKTLFRNASCELVFYIPADRQNPPGEIINYLPLIENGEADIILGYRVKRADPFYRIVFNKVYHFCLRLFFGLKFRDIETCDLYKKEVLDKIQIESEGVFLKVEIVVKALHMGYKIKEVPIVHYPRIAGRQTGIKPRWAFKAIKDMLTQRKKIKALLKER